MSAVKQEKNPETQANEPVLSPNSQESSSQKDQASSEQKTGEIVVSKKTYNQKWPAEQEEIFANWADIAACYRLLHDWSQKRYHKLNLILSIPVILLTTLTGSANLSISSVTGTDLQDQKISNLIIGGISIIAGILSTISNFLRYAPNMEAHRIASLAWGKLYRAISVELALDRSDRKDSMDYLKICRSDIDRLIDQSPAIPEAILKRFEQQFKQPIQKKLEGQAVIKKPDICNYLEHTYIYRPLAKIEDITTEGDDTKSEVGFKGLPPLKEASLNSIQKYVDAARILNQPPEIIVDNASTQDKDMNEINKEIADKTAKLRQTTDLVIQQREAAKKAQNDILYPQNSTSLSNPGNIYYLG